MRLNFMIAAGLLSLAVPAQAIRLSAGLGMGSSTSARDASYSEGPLIQAYAVEYDRDSRNVYGVEHLRSLGMSPLSTAISYSGLSYRFYFNGSPGPFNDLGGIRKNTVEFRDWSLFTGASFGLAQSTAPPDEGQERGAAGVYLSPKIGTDLPMSGSWGVRGELLMTFMVFGAGSISSMGLGGGIYINF